MSFVLPVRFESERMLWTIPDVYDRAECAEFVRKIEAWGPTIATNNPMYRDQDRVMRDEPAIAQDLFVRLRPHLPERMGPLRLSGLNERLRFYRYQVGQQFPAHTDHWYWPSDHRVTLHTVLVYFNEEFEGGETRFVEHLDDVIVPKTGLVAVFQHKLRHEGSAVRRGVKYAMRTDVIYESGVPVLRPGAA